MPSPYTTKLGITHVGPLYNRGPTQIQDAIDAIVDTYNCDSIMVFMSPNYKGDIISPGAGAYIDQVWGPTVVTDLTTLAQTIPYQYLFTHPDINRIFLKTWTFATSIGDPWRVFANQDFIMDAEYGEIKDLTAYLLTNFPNKDFIIQTSESDWSYIGPGFTERPNPIAQGRDRRFTSFADARIRGVEDGRIGITTSSRVLSGIELNLVLDDPMNRVHNDVLWRLNPDYISLTVYEAINEFLNATLTQEEVLANIKKNMRRIVKNIRRQLRKHRGQYASNTQIIVGEWGWPENHPSWLDGDVHGNPFSAVAHTDAFLEVCDELGIPFANFWQLWCNDEVDYGDGRGIVRTDQCVEKEGGARSVTGEYLRQLLLP